LRTLLILSIAVLCSCSHIEKPKTVTEIQIAQSNQFSPVNVVYKSMIRALVNISQKDSMAGEMDLEFVNQIDRIYYYSSANSNRPLDSLLGARLDSIVFADTYSELSEIVSNGKTYRAYIKNTDQLVSEILVLQQSSSEIVLISVIGEIKLEEVMKNINQLPSLLQFADAMPL
jgi:hypothetical protein